MSRVILAMASLKNSVSEYTEKDLLSLIDNANSFSFLSANAGEAIGIMNNFFDDNPDPHFIFVFKSREGVFPIFSHNDVSDFDMGDYGNLVAENLNHYNVHYVQAKPEIDFKGHRSCLFFYTPWSKVFNAYSKKDIHPVIPEITAKIDQTEDSTPVDIGDNVRAMSQYMPLIFVGESEEPISRLGESEASSFFVNDDSIGVKPETISNFQAPIGQIDTVWIALDADGNVEKFYPDIMASLAESGDIYAKLGLAVSEATKKNFRDYIAKE